MTLLVTASAACICTVVWYKTASKSEMKLGILCLMYWGAALMWLVDAIFEFAELHEAYFTPAPADMLNDLFLGLAVVVLGMIIWLIILLIKDPKGVVKTAIFKKS